ncbi:hypothetical protein GQ54DRAFT_295392 [Martensiomyces pterosporus]|nr:hypothetical protein GQ54DRAFT_295392 [Martensiomyces pterosporus]
MCPFLRVSADPSSPTPCSATSVPFCADGMHTAFTPPLNVLSALIAVDLQTGWCSPEENADSIFCEPEIDVVDAKGGDGRGTPFAPCRKLVLALKWHSCFCFCVAGVGQLPIHKLNSHTPYYVARSTLPHLLSFANCSLLFWFSPSPPASLRIPCLSKQTARRRLPYLPAPIVPSQRSLSPALMPSLHLCRILHYAWRIAGISS